MTCECRDKVINSRRQRMRRLDTSWCTVTRGPDVNTTKANTLRQQFAVAMPRGQPRKEIDRLRTRLAAPPDESARDFYSRITTAYTGNTIFALGHGMDRLSSARLADAMTQGWMAVMQQDHASDAVVKEFLVDTSLPATNGLQLLAAPVTALDVVRAMRICKRGKAQGPDEL